MKIVDSGSKTDFKIKIGTKYMTIATLTPWLFSKHSHIYNLYFYYYGAEFNEGIYARNHFNGNVRIKVWQEDDETWNDFIKRVREIVLKKLYVIGNSILDEIKYIEI